MVLPSNNAINENDIEKHICNKSKQFSLKCHNGDNRIGKEVKLY